MRRSDSALHDGTDWAIRTQDLSYRYGGGHGVQALDLRVPRGAIYAFLGANGAGKTTTIRLLLGLLAPQTGTVELLGEATGPVWRRLARVGALVESPSLYPHLSGRDNLEITRRLRDAAPARVDAALDLVGLSADAHRFVGDYSLGMRQRLGIALALVGDPQLLILDEPSNGLDPAGIVELRQLLQRLSRDTQISVFVSSHLLVEVEQIATHVGVLAAGKLRFQGAIDDLRARSCPLLRLRCTDTPRATEYLRTQGWNISSDDSGWIALPAKSTEAPRLIHDLYSRGIDVLDLVIERASLETQFFALSRDDGGDA